VLGTQNRPAQATAETGLVSSREAAASFCKPAGNRSTKPRVTAGGARDSEASTRMASRTERDLAAADPYRLRARNRLSLRDCSVEVPRRDPAARCGNSRNVALPGHGRGVATGYSSSLSRTRSMRSIAECDLGTFAVGDIAVEDAGMAPLSGRQRRRRCCYVGNRCSSRCTTSAIPALSVPSSSGGRVSRSRRSSSMRARIAAKSSAARGLAMFFLPSPFWFFAAGQVGQLLWPVQAAASRVGLDALSDRHPQRSAC
jgi:hypothetical protein